MAVHKFAWAHAHEYCVVVILVGRNLWTVLAEYEQLAVDHNWSMVSAGEHLIKE